jgi:hypothetical protein
MDYFWPFPRDESRGYISVAPGGALDCLADNLPSTKVLGYFHEIKDDS